MTFLGSGVSGNRTGNKMYCFNTSIRVPDKNIEFLRILKKYEGKLFTDAIRIEVYKDAIQTGTLMPVNMSDKIKEKIRHGEILTDEEMYKVLKENRPRNDFTGRVGDYVMALENQALVQRLGTPRKYRVRVTDLGNKLLEDNANELDIYTRAMIGLKYGSPTRDNVKNKAVPFLNTLFIIKYLSDYYKEEFKGITLYEFGVFVLTMKNCKYETIAKKIIDYRKKYGNQEDEEFAMKYLIKNGIESYSRDTLYGSGSYGDEVLRKFKKTGLISDKNSFVTRYINFNKHELPKIELLLEEYKDYSWKRYKDADDYYESIETIVLPWEASDSNYYKILRDKADKINYQLNEGQITRDDYENVNRLYYQYIFENNDYSQFPYENIIKELGLINRTVEGDSCLQDVEEYVRLEWFTALLLAHKYGRSCVKSNLVLDDDGLPLSQATGGHADIEMINNDIKYNIEVTTIRNRTQQLNAETTTVARHMAANMENEVVKAMLVAPYVHEDTIRYYRFEAVDADVILVPMSIDMLIKTVERSETLADFDNNIDSYCKYMKEHSVKEVVNYINDFQ